MADTTSLKLKIQIIRGDEIAMGPGKADLLDAIERTGSISAAGRTLGMSYRRCWMLVEVMNRCWSASLVEASVGGTKGGGAKITDMGRDVLGHYRALQNHISSVGQDADWQALNALLRTEAT